MESPAPQRTCVGCRRKDAQPLLIRIARLPSGELEITETNKRSGRGAYVCPRRECVELALKGERLGRALRGPVDPERKERLRAALVEKIAD